MSVKLSSKWLKMKNLWQQFRKMCLLAKSRPLKRKNLQRFEAMVSKVTQIRQEISSKLWEKWARQITPSPPMKSKVITICCHRVDLEPPTWEIWTKWTIDSLRMVIVRRKITKMMVISTRRIGTIKVERETKTTNSENQINCLNQSPNDLERFLKFLMINTEKHRC